MKSKKYLIVFIILFLLTITFDSMALDTEGTRATLKGLQGICVLVEDIIPEAVEDGLTKELLQTDVELRIRKAGIKVLTKEEGRRAPGAPVLYVNVALSKRKNIKLYAFYIEVTLAQGVSLKRNPTIITLVGTWSVDSLGSVGERLMKNYIREHVGELVDKFINVYLAVNPK